MAVSLRQNGVGASFVGADAILAKGHNYLSHMPGIFCWRLSVLQFTGEPHRMKLRRILLQRNFSISDLPCMTEKKASKCTHRGHGCMKYFASAGRSVEVYTYCGICRRSCGSTSVSTANTTLISADFGWSRRRKVWLIERPCPAAKYGPTLGLDHDSGALLLHLER